MNYFVGRMGKLVGNTIENRRRGVEKERRMIENGGRKIDEGGEIIDYGGRKKQLSKNLPH